MRTDQAELVLFVVLLVMALSYLEVRASAKPGAVQDVHLPPLQVFPKFTKVPDMHSRQCAGEG